VVPRHAYESYPPNTACSECHALFFAQLVVEFKLKQKDKEYPHYQHKDLICCQASYLLYASLTPALYPRLFKKKKTPLAEPIEIENSVVWHYKDALIRGSRQHATILQNFSRDHTQIASGEILKEQLDLEHM